MKMRFLTDRFAVSGQVSLDALQQLADQGFVAIICVRPDAEEEGQPSFAELGVMAEKLGMSFAYIPVKAGNDPNVKTVAKMCQTLEGLGQKEGKVLAYCRSGKRAATLFARAQELKPKRGQSCQKFDIVIVGGGSAGIATAASILKRAPQLTLAIVEPSLDHFYQPGWTLVGGGVMTPAETRRSEVSVMPAGANWIRRRVESFVPDSHRVVLDDGTALRYRGLVVAAGIKLDWDAIAGLTETLGKNGVTSNYRFDLAPLTWEYLSNLTKGVALFTQPPMPIKCAGAPQKAMYLACDAWRKRKVDQAIEVAFHTANEGLFAVPAFVPALKAAIARYSIALNTRSNLVAVDGERRIATFEQVSVQGTQRVEKKFDFLHVVPPQAAPDFISHSPLAGEDGFVDVDSMTLQHRKFPNVFAVGDVAGISAAKTAAAARKQAPVVATNLLAVLAHRAAGMAYDGYGACPLIVERGKVVLAEFGYKGVLLPTLPRWLLKGERPTRLAWFLKRSIMPLLYWHFMLRGRELMARPKASEKR